MRANFISSSEFRWDSKDLWSSLLSTHASHHKSGQLKNARQENSCKCFHSRNWQTEQVWVLSHPSKHSWAHAHGEYAYGGWGRRPSIKSYFRPLLAQLDLLCAAWLNSMGEFCHSFSLKHQQPKQIYAQLLDRVPILFISLSVLGSYIQVTIIFANW